MWLVMMGMSVVDFECRMFVFGLDILFALGIVRVRVLRYRIVNIVAYTYESIYLI